MSLPNVLLSLLREPMSGSELTELFGSSIGHFWSADLSQIYRALDSLEQRGCVKSKSVPSPRGPARRVYSLTAPGRYAVTMTVPIGSSWKSSARTCADYCEGDA